jgi:hypothetical protein
VNGNERVGHHEHSVQSRVVRAAGHDNAAAHVVDVQVVQNLPYGHFLPRHHHVECLLLVVQRHGAVKAHQRHQPARGHVHRSEQVGVVWSVMRLLSTETYFPRVYQSRGAMSLLSAGLSNTVGVGFSGGMPTFPATNTLESSNFKVVVGSWRRMNASTKPSTSDFTVDVTEYAPRSPYITRVQLVDVDLPATQRVIEDAWARLYFQQGVPLTPTCRSLDITADGVTIPIVLPLLLDEVKAYESVGASVVRMYMTRRAPEPVAAVAEMWKHLPGGGMRVLGVPGFHDGFLLTRDNVRPSTIASMAFDIVSAEFAEAVRSRPTGVLLLYAPPLLGATCLAAVLTNLIPFAVALSHVEDSSGGAWSIQFQYSVADDRFAVYTRVPAFVENMELRGALAEYMGFDATEFVEVKPFDARVGTTNAASPRRHPRDAYALLPSSNPTRPTDITGAVEKAYNAYTWARFRFGVTLPGHDTTSVYTVPGGRMTLWQLAEVVSALLNDAHITVKYVKGECRSGLQFEHLTGLVFQVDWTVDAAFDPSHVGYDRRVTPLARVHVPTRAAKHVPMPSGDAPAMSDIAVLYNEDTQTLMFQSVPFSPFSGVCARLNANVRIVTCEIAHGLQVGARVILSAVDPPPDIQVCVVVVAVHDVLRFDVMLVDPSDDGALGNEPVVVVPQDRFPLNLYLQQTRLIREKAVCPNLIGLQPMSYETPYELVSSGALDLRADPYLLLCISFQGEDAGLSCGSVYYPLESGGGQIIFGKILKSACAFKSEYDRAFYHDFKGAGIHLGYIRIRILNSDGTAYESHGQPVSVCLKFEARQSSVFTGGPGTLQALSDSGKW